MVGKKRRGFVVFLIAITLWGTWITFLNNRISDENLPIVVKKAEDIGEWVAFGDNYYGKTYLNGCEIRIKSVRFYESQEYLSRISELRYPESERADSGKVCEVEVEIRNTGKENRRISFLELFLTGRDFYSTIQTDWIRQINNLEEGAIGLELLPDSETALRMPYLFSEISYREKLGRTLEQEPLWLLLTAYPERVMARVQ